MLMKCKFVKPKVGDLVRLKPLIVEQAYSGVIDNVIVASGMTLNARYIEEILPRPLAVGDRVMDGLTFLEGTILAIADDEAWVQWDDKPKQVVPLIKLFRSS